MKKTNKLMVLIALAIMPMLFSHCTLTEDLGKLKTSLDSVKIVLGTPKFITTVNLRFVDAKTHEPISDQVVSVNISGKDAAKVYNNIGKRADAYSAHEGRLDLVFDPHAVDTSTIKTNPIQFTVTPTLSGYMSAPQIVTITNAKRSYVDVPMMDVNNPPDGVTIFQNIDVGTTDANGVFTQSQTASFVKGKSGRLKSTGSDTIAYGSMNVEIPAGAIFKDYAGKPLVGKVSMYGWYYNSNSGYIGCYVFSDRNKGLYTQFGYQMYLYVIGNKTKDIVDSIVNRDIKIKFFLPGAAINNMTKLSWKENDVIPFWQYGTDWLLHNTKTDTIKSENNHLFLEQRGKYSYLTTKRMDSFTCGSAIWGFPIPVCPITFNYNYVSNPAYGETWINHEMTNYLVSSASVGVFLQNRDLRFSYGPNFNSEFGGSFPLGYTTKHTFSLDPWWNDPDFTSQFSPQEIVTDDGSCGSTYNITLTKTAKPGVKFISANLDISLVSNKNTVIKPNDYFYINESSLDGYYVNSIYVYLEDGKALINLKLDREYFIYNWLGNEWVRRYFIIKDNGAEYEISVSTDANNSDVVATYKVPKSAVVDFKLDIPISGDLFNSL